MTFREIAVTDLLQKIEHTPQLQPQRDRMVFLDGVRGAAALYVAVFHAYMQLNWSHDGGGLSRPVGLAARILSAGGYGVVAFIVLSGYCLMLPVARSSDGHLRGGAGYYLLRRCKRIMPAYYSALMVALLLIWTIPGLSIHPACFADAATPVTHGGLLSHLLLVHDVNGDWQMNIDPPMWTVALEFQIYFLLPFLFLPVYRKWGATAVLVTAYLFVIGINLAIGWGFFASYTHFIGLFAMGVLGADATAGHGAEVQRLRKLPWRWISIFCFIGAFIMAILNPRWAPRDGWAPHALFGVAAVGLLICCGRKLPGAKMFRRFMESKWFVWLGGFSYSLYLIHMPFEAVTFLIMKQWIHSPDLLLIVNVFIAVPIVTLLAYGFYRIFERPFLGAPTPHK